MEKKLYRSKSDRMLFGVCGGIAEYFGIDSTIIRVITVLLLFAGSGIAVLYLLLAIIVPENPSQKKSEAKVSKINNYWLGLGLVVTGLLLLLNAYNILDWAKIWPALVIMLGVFMVWQNQKK